MRNENYVSDLFRTIYIRKAKEEKRTKEMLELKPDLKVYPNHRKVLKIPNRYWNSFSYGTAYSDGYGWYKQTGEKK